ncbi:HU family DNA-binding protein [Methylobacterium radiotolerans]|uniref:Histone family protein DNA-binding protein n=1 Tax=Methylobacterium radiotolerans (strain ATCC 27329 / DSM 1819 / JCM 2831 / NBRC 15690 / NCIMB 10815 / 0-1) TaxID=426355 RepID=B1M9X1_METRJ|nr:HU family DNA-binding protein [Methylobacterium radiotolerans]ACB28296.1 histone family protein DNA-binding protein [Methylobacterium radiotolerans JCM 2831]ACB28325.1 histone family protein DNA-binding protein [Methylobacterium radiotolerans JCM 2831]GEN01904.1 integration host factor subunit beta [Methylobacterium radiotolerans]
MIRSELVARIAAKNPHLYARDVEAIVATILKTMTTALVRGDRIELREFGTFTVRHHRARIARNPRSQAVVTVPAKGRVAFKPSKAMRELLQAKPLSTEHSPAPSPQTP